METAIALAILVVGYLVWRRVRSAMMVSKTRRDSPRYAAHIQECDVCFRDGGPYPFEPCPEGKEIMREEWLEREEG